MNTLELLNTIACAYIIGQSIGILLYFIEDLKEIGLLVSALILMVVPSVTFAYFTRYSPETLEAFKQTIWYYPVIVCIIFTVITYAWHAIYRAKMQMDMQ